MVRWKSRIGRIEEKAPSHEMLRTVRDGYKVVCAKATDKIRTPAKDEYFSYLRPQLKSNNPVPVSAGFLARAMRFRRAARVFVILIATALTGYVRVEERMQSLVAGYHLFVPKPIEADKLAATVANLTGRSKQALSA